MDDCNRNTYETIAEEFSETRSYVWKCVKDFADKMQPGKILEVGSGNGKNMLYLKKHAINDVVGIDTCQNFIEICRQKYLDAILASSVSLPFQDDQFDNLLCIAMFHHLLNDEDRDKSMNEIIRVMKPGARGIITCWSTIQPENSKFSFSEGVNLVPWIGRKNTKKTMRYYYVYNEQMFRDYFAKFDKIEIEQIYNEVGNWILVFRKK
jgi:ubiquinone/menaquinone biosynthesis C-methylase UbiE